MIKISKQECEILRSKGVKMGENGISHTLGNGRKKTYYMCESSRNKLLLDSIRNGQYN